MDEIVDEFEAALALANPKVIYSYVEPAPKPKNHYFDHIIMFANEDEAKATLRQHHTDGEWHGYTIPNLVISVGEMVIPGYFINIALPMPNDELINLPNEACRLISDRDAAVEGENFFVYVAPSLDLKLLSTATVSPVFMGSEYPFCE